MATQQVKQAIKKLRQAGLERSEFSVQVERHYIGCYNGKATFEYGNATIVLWLSPKKSLNMAKAMANAGLKVEIWITKNTSIPRIRDNGKSGIWEIDYNNCNEWGLPEKRKIY